MVIHQDMDILVHMDSIRCPARTPRKSTSPVYGVASSYAARQHGGRGSLRGLPPPVLPGIPRAKKQSPPRHSILKSPGNDHGSPTPPRAPPPAPPTPSTPPSLLSTSHSLGGLRATLGGFSQQPSKFGNPLFWLHYRVWGTIQVAARGNLLFAQRQIGGRVGHSLYVPRGN